MYKLCERREVRGVLCCPFQLQLWERLPDSCQWRRLLLQARVVANRRAGTHCSRVLESQILINNVTGLAYLFLL